MLPQVLSLLRPERGGTYVDGTLGGGGHSLGILRSLPAGGRLFGIDRDGEAIAEGHNRHSHSKPFLLSSTLPIPITKRGIEVCSVLIRKGITVTEIWGFCLTE